MDHRDNICSVNASSYDNGVTSLNNIYIVT